MGRMRLLGQKLKLRKEHMLLMRIPERYWRVSFAEIRQPDLRGVLERYCEDLHENLDFGVGFLFWGTNGLGKTGAACALAKVVRQTGASVLFITAESLRQAILGNEVFSDFQTLEERALTVDLLVLDDLGKEHKGQTGWSETYWENFFRVRNASQRATIVTTNLAPSDLKKRYHTSMSEVMKEAIVPFHVEGDDRREEAARELAKKLAVG